LQARQIGSPAADPRPGPSRRPDIFFEVNPAATSKKWESFITFAMSSG
jgi:hypothetical protein